MSNIAQRSFGAGELGPALYARTDLARYATGLRTCRNFVVERHGGIANRPGTTFVAEVQDSTQPVRLVPFVFSPSDALMLEFGDQYMRLYQNGAPIWVSTLNFWTDGAVYAQGDLVTNGVTYCYYCDRAHTAATVDNKPNVGSAWQTYWTQLPMGPLAISGGLGVPVGWYEIGTPYAAADLMALQCVQSNDVVTIVHPSYPPMELKRLAMEPQPYGDFRWTLTPITFGPAIPPPSGLAASGGGAGPSDVFWAVTSIDTVTGEESLPTTLKETTNVPAGGTPVTLSWAPVVNALAYNVYRCTDGSSYGFVGRAGGGLQPDSATFATTSNATATSLAAGSWVASGSQARGTMVSAAADKPRDGTYTILATITVAAAGGTPTVTLGRIGAYYSRDGEPRVFAGYLTLSGGGTVASVSGASTFGPAVMSLTISVPDNVYTGLVIDLVPEVKGTGVGATWTSRVDGTSVSWSKVTSGYIDSGTTPDFAVQPPVQPTTFAQSGNYPSAVGYFQQRQWFANTTSDPERLWGSRVGSYHAFTTSTPDSEDDAIDVRLASRQVSRVKHLLDLDTLLAFTDTTVTALAGDQAGIIRPASINARPLSFTGAGDLSPIAIGSSALYVQARGNVVRDLAAAIAATQSGQPGLVSSDLTLVASHLFTGYTLADWAYAETPNSVVWAVRSDGTLLGLTYVRDQGVLAWHRHDTDGVIERVCVVPEGIEDAVYLVVRRTVNGASVRYVERMASRGVDGLTGDIVDAVFVDASVTYDGRNTGTVTVTLTGGTLWDPTESLTLTASDASIWLDEDLTLGRVLILTADDGTLVRLAVESYSSTTVASVRPDVAVPSEFHGVATTAWVNAVAVVSGLDHLDGESVSVLGDGYVVASPNNIDPRTLIPAYPTITVASGAVTLPAAYGVIHVGLPYVSDMETLDLDTAQGPSLKERKFQVSRVGLMVASSRGIWAGRAIPSATQTPLSRLQELKLRADEGYDSPTALATAYVELNIETGWDTNGRVGVRQVDPLPLTILSVTPIGAMA